jgi:endogenous inhibitor of DNA gyrase (YacG/DUF329 family)
MRVKCPTCKTEVEWSSASPHRPFCSKKCQLIDIGEWVAEERTISTPSNNLGTPSPQDIEEIEALLSQQEDNFFKH